VNPSSTPSGGRLALVIIGGLVATASVAILAFAGFLHWVNGKRDDGYFTTGTVRLEVLGPALTSDLDVHRGLVSVIGKDGFSRVRLHVRSTRSEPVFVGVARSGDVSDYLRNTGATRLSDFNLAPFKPFYTESIGDETPAAPGEQTFWTAKAQGTGTVTLDWDVEPGGWTLVVMDAADSPGVQVTADAGAQIPLIGRLAWIVTVVGLVVLALGVLMLVLGLRRRRPQPSSPAGSAWGA
jgi:hypothetical protein